MILCWIGTSRFPSSAHRRMRYRVLVSAPYFQPVLDEYHDVFSRHDITLEVPPVEERMSEAELLACIGDIDGVICGDDSFTDRVFQHAPRLKVISKWGTGIDSIDAEAAKRHGVRVCNTPDAFTVPVADSVLGYVLCFARQLHVMDRAMKSGNWEKIPGVALNECTLGIIGLGNIGKAVARRATVFGIRILGNDIQPVDEAFVSETGATVTSKDQLFRESDFVSMHCDLNPTSKGLVGFEQLTAMKSTAYLINTSRGPVISERALVRALQTGEIAGAALDVYEDEPLPADSPLRTMNNCLLAPHNANSSPKAWRRVHSNTVRSLLEGLSLDPDLSDMHPVTD